MAKTIGYGRVTLAGNDSDVFKTGRAVDVYGIAVPGTDVDVDFYDTLANKHTGTSPTISHFAANAKPVQFFVTPIRFASGVFIDAVGGTVVTFFYELVAS